MARSLLKATIVGWSGRGSLEDLGSSLEEILKGGALAPTVEFSGTSAIVRGPEPARAASALRNTPGVSWLAVGMASDTLGEIGEATRVLGRRYLRANSSFSVAALGGAGVSASDVAGTVVSAALDTVKGVRVSESKPQVMFRASLSNQGGAVGVEIARGPGGVPTGSRTATVLLSGGMHSSVLCWMALLSGYRLRIVHAKVDDESLLAVARLYSELSHRVDPSALNLDVLFGRDAGSLVNWAARDAHHPVFAGFHSGCSELRGVHLKGTISPLYLAQEEWFLSEASGLSLKPYASRQGWGRIARAPSGMRSFGGVRSDVNSLLDGPLSRRQKVR